MKSLQVTSLLATTVILLAAAFGTGCGGDSSTAKPTLTVSAASSLKTPFTAYGREFTSADTRFSFAGSDELAAQIRQGVKPDVFAAANTKLPAALFAEGLVEKPVAFAGSRLVVAVPAGSGKVNTFDDLQKDGIRLAIGSKSVPIGAYTRKLLDQLPQDQADAILANVRSEEPNVHLIAGKVAQGGADAGFVYVTDVSAAGGRLRAVELPAELKSTVAYGVAVVKGAKQPEQAQKFIDGLLDGQGQQALADAGFEPPPSK